MKTALASRLLLHEALFWLHFAVILAGLSMGLILPWYVVLVLVGIHRLHIWWFGGCALSKLQSQVGGLAKKENYLQQFSRRAFEKNITPSQVVVIDRIIIASSLLITVIRYLIGPWLVVTALFCVLAGFALFWSLKIHQAKKRFAGACGLVENCSNITATNFGSVFGLPVEMLGAVYFALIIGLQLAQLFFNFSFLADITHSLLTIGFITSVFFMSIQFGILKQICYRCSNTHMACCSMFTLNTLTPLFS